MKLFAFLLTLYLISNVGKADSKDSSSFLRSIFANKNENLIFRLYRRGSSVNLPTEICDGSCEKITFKKLSTNKPIKIIIHGWRGHGGGTLFQELVKAYLDNFDYNVITVDWSSLGAQDNLYPIARNEVPVVASKVAKFIYALKIHRGIRLDKLHVIGHSLGAHIAGVAANQLHPGKLGRITGLDPAGPLFSDGAPLERISPDDALFVDIIHTCTHYLGFGGPLGHADFYPNGPIQFQPGCFMDVTGICSHGRSYQFYAESIYNPKTFQSVACADWQRFLGRACNMNKVVAMGEFTPAKTRGVYYLSTNSKIPFGRDTLW